MRKKVISVLLAGCMVASLAAGCGESEKTGSAGTEETGASAVDGKEYTYNTTYSSVSTWNPTDWEISSEWDLLGYTMSEFYGFVMNETKDGYDITCELASEFPVDVTSEYAGNEIYGVPADATEGYAWKISIRDDAVWQDGTPITVDDVEYSLQQFLSPEMKNYRASLFYTGGTGLANARAYYESDKAGEANISLATDAGTFAVADLTAGEDGQYVTPDGAKVYFGWSVPIDNDWMGGYSLYDYAAYMTEDVYGALAALVNEDGYIPVTEESYSLLYSFTGSDAWGGEAEDDLINYIFFEDGVVEATPWENVGYVKDDDYTFTVILKNPSKLLDFEMNIGSLVLLNKELYEANKQETGGIIKSSYGTSVDKFSSYGPYKIVSYQESKEIRLEKNESWYGWTDGNHEGWYQTTAINMQQIDEHTTQMSMFLQGKLDGVSLTADDMEKYGTSDYVYYTPDTYVYYFTLNTDFDAMKSRETEGVNKTICTYLDFRKALSLAIDRNDYVKSCTAGFDAAYGLLNNIYICDPEIGTTYRSTEYAQKALCDVYGVDDINELTGYDKEAASALLQSAYDQCYADGNIGDNDIVEIEYHVYGTESSYQKQVDYVQQAMDAAAAGTSLEGRIKFMLVEDQDFYDSMKSGQDDMIRGAWGGADMDPYAMMQCYTDPDYIIEYGFNSYAPLTISVQGQEITKSYYDWYIALCEGEYAIADLDVRNEILAGMEKGILLNYHVIPVCSYNIPTLISQRIVLGSEEYINSIVGRGGIAFMTYTMDDAEWEEYCAEQGNDLAY
ncbi:MAG: ABC transporter substrate-binding protein [Agathobacter sp.]